MTITNLESALPWVEKYRPATLEDVVSHHDVIETVRRYINSGQLPHLLFHGPPGTGKTSTILVIAHILYSRNYKSCVLELNASDDRGISTVRDQIKVFAESKNSFGLPIEATHENEDANASNTSFSEGKAHLSSSVKLIILDEADQMTSAAQNALRRIMEQYAKNVRFCLICNYINKINPAIQSRCTGFRFAPLNSDDASQKVKQICKLEDVNITSDGLATLLHAGKGDMRKVLNALQVSAMSNKGKAIDTHIILTSLGLPSEEEMKLLISMLLENSFNDAVFYLKRLKSVKGYSANDILTALYQRCICIQWPNNIIIQLLIRLADIEERISLGSTEDIQMCAIVSAFVEARYELENLKIKLNF